MERAKRIRKAVVLVSAALLIAGFVLYRAGLLGPLYMTSTKSSFMFIGSSVKPAETPATDTTLPTAPPPREVPTQPTVKPTD